MFLFSVNQLIIGSIKCSKNVLNGKKKEFLTPKESLKSSCFVTSPVKSSNFSRIKIQKKILHFIFVCKIISKIISVMSK